MNRIRFRYAVLFLLLTSTIVAVWMATKSQSFDDVFTGPVVINGVPTENIGTVSIKTERFDDKPSITFGVEAPSREKALAQGINEYYVGSNTSCSVTGYHDKRDNKDFNAVVEVQFEPYSPRLHCANAVLKVESFNKMTVVINPDKPSERLEMSVEREYLRNPVILAAQYAMYISGRRAMSFY